MITVADLLTRGVEKIYPSRESLEANLDKKLKVYQGFDPTSPQLHIGHLIGLRKLRQWQELGHEVIFLIGDYTATIGDPTDKEASRTPMTREEVEENAKTYKEQASKILMFDGENPAKMLFNSEWLSKISATELLKLSENITHSQLIERDMFQRRFKKGSDVYLSELLYPLMQAYDSLHMDVDVEVGGSDQTFNMLMGRKLMRNVSKKEKFIMTLPLFTVDGEKKMGKSEGNAIGISSKPSDLFAKIMALGDDVIAKGFEYLTDLPMDEVKQISEDLKGGKNPVSYKKKLAFEIVKQLNSHEDAHKAQDEFEKTIQNKSESIEAQLVEFKKGKSLSEIAIESKLVASNSEWKRLISQKGIKANDKPVEETNAILSEETTLQRGRKVIKIKPV